MTFYLLSYQSVCVSSIWCQASWPWQYYLFMQLYATIKAFHAAFIAESILNVLDNRGDASCPSLWLLGVKPVTALVLLGWMVHCSCIHMSQSICGRWADICVLGHSLCLGKIQREITVVKVPNENVWLFAEQIAAVCVHLDKVDALPEEVNGYILEVFPRVWLWNSERSTNSFILPLKSVRCRQSVGGGREALIMRQFKNFAVRLMMWSTP